MKADWDKLRPWSGDRKAAFEELVCQLAHAATDPDHDFVRLDPPDGGVEAFARTPKGRERGWQAKWFTGPISASQWSNIDKSVRAAVAAHPKLDEYIVCLPQNLTDAQYAIKRRRGARADAAAKAQGSLKKWTALVAKWKAICKGRRIRFVFWGAFELEQRLQSPGFRDRRAFWFGEIDVTRATLEARLAEAVAEAGPKYTPDLHIAIDIARTIDGVGRNPAFRTRWIEALRAVRKSATALNRLRELDKTVSANLQEQLLVVQAEAAKFADPLGRLPDLGRLSAAADALQGTVNEHVAQLRAQIAAARTAARQDAEGQGPSQQDLSLLEFDRQELSQFSDAISALHS